jgi:predicted TIM-barrel fold metal-dependent hydrolase
MNRRELVRLAGGFAIACAATGMAEASKSTPIIDSHIHLFDPTRSGGVPWPEKTDPVIYRPELPARYERIARPLGVVGAIAIEASPLESDNDWVLNQVAANPIMVGMVGDLIPGSPSYGKDLDRLHANPHFLGIRYGNLWKRDLSVDMKKPGFIGDLRRLAEAGLELDSANPDPDLIRGLLEVSQQVPELRIVVDHLPGAQVPTEPNARRHYESNLKILGQNSRVFIKLSEIPVRENNEVQTNIVFYKDKLDALWEIFGEDHVLFGSDWPNSDHIASFGDTLGIVQRYVSTKSAAASEKFFWKNSVAAYRWQPRAADQRLA